MGNNEDGYNIIEVNNRLFQIITDMSALEKRELLKELENRIRSKTKDKRKHRRKYASIEVSCSIHDATLADTSIHEISFMDSILNLSKGGVFIESIYPFRMNQQLSLTFSLPEVKDSITITGEIVRIDTNGIGVKFDEPLTAM